MNTGGRGSSSCKRRSESSISRRFYQSDVIDHKMLSYIDAVETNDGKASRAKQSRQLPYWAWYIIAKCNGIPLRKGDRPIFGTILHGLTFASALIYLSSYFWFVVYDIMSPDTPRDVAGGTVSIFLVLCWCAFGYYCKTLSSRMFLQKRFLKDVRMHSRTVFKINASLLVVVLGTLFTFAYLFESIIKLNWEHCEKVELDIVVCSLVTVSSIVFAIFTLIWHSLVSFIFISVCRTHTIGLRCFMKDIEVDAQLIQHRHSFMYKNYSEDIDIWQDVMWTSRENSIDESAAIKSNVLDKERSAPLPKEELSERPSEIGILLSPVSDNLESSNAYSSNDENTFYGSMDSDSPPVQCMTVIAANKGNDEERNNALEIMSSAEILHNYWNLNSRLRFSASALQRWLASFIALVLLRCSTYLVHWLTHQASIFDILQFILPLIMLVILSAAIAEVNFEGQRVTRCIYPTQERMQLLQFLSLNQLQMPIYGFGMTHGTIVTVVFAILVGFVTRIVITELTK